jgi:hypothetical protein
MVMVDCGWPMVDGDGQWYMVDGDGGRLNHHEFMANGHIVIVDGDGGW